MYLIQAAYSLACSVLFLSDQFLKYIGWMLHDKVCRHCQASIHLCCNTFIVTWLKLVLVLFQFSVQVLSLSLPPFQVAQIRLVCVQSLQELYNPSLVYHLSMFTAKFKERLLKMRSDIDETVAVEVIKLLGQMLE